ncbi:MAG: hypothetical protein U0790_23270 [Isosphaeraceae bacterium]
MIFLLVGLCDGPNPILRWSAFQAALIALASILLHRSLLRIPAIGRGGPGAAEAGSPGRGCPDVVGEGQTTEALAVSLEVIAYALALDSATRLRIVGAFLSGLCSFLAIGLRQPFVLHLVAYLPLLAMAARRQGRRGCALLAGALAAGWLFGLAALAAHAVSHDYGHGLLQTIRDNRAYAIQHAVPFGSSLIAFKNRMYRLIADNELAVVLPCMTLAARLLWRARGRRSPRLEMLERSASLWLVAALVGVFPGGRHFPHYYHGLWAPLAILSPLWLSRLAIVAGSRPLSRTLALGLVGGVVLACGLLQSVRVLAVAARGPDEVSARVREAAEYLEATTSTDEVVPYLLYGDWAELFWRVPRPPMAGCVAPALFAPHGDSGHHPQRFRRWLSAVRTDPPRVVVARETDLAPPPEPGREPPDAEFRQWVEWLRREYEVDRRFGELLILKRRHAEGR